MHHARHAAHHVIEQMAVEEPVADFVRRELDHATEVAGLGHVTSHQLRHTYATALVNGSFETPFVNDGTYALYSPNDVPGWNTDDSAIEIWGNGFLGVPAAEGSPSQPQIVAEENGV
jgi:hypothetical protein